MKRVAAHRQGTEEVQGRRRETSRRQDRRVQLVRADERSAKATPSALDWATAPLNIAATQQQVAATESTPRRQLTTIRQHLVTARRRLITTARRAITPLRRLITAGRLSFVLVAALICYGWSAQTQRYLAPNRGLGYALGIIGASLMLVSLAYSLRKRWQWLGFLGSTPGWFKFHMVLGIAGPLCILYHSNFGTGATNSNVALFSMLTVAGSGVIGRYIYGHVHNELYGRKIELRELQADADSLRSSSGTFTPELIARLESAEQRLLNAGSRVWGLGYLKPFVVSLAALRARVQLRRYVRSATGAGPGQPGAPGAPDHTRRQALAYVDRRLTATRRVAEFDGYERLFSLWHSLHIPMIFVMVVAAIVHVIAVNVY